MSRHHITLNVNGQDHKVWVEAEESLLDVLHDELGMADVRYGCGEGVCGTCTVLVDGKPMNGCLVFAVQAQDVPITTVVGMTQDDGSMHPLQDVFLKRGGAQCGFCTPGMLLTSLSMLEDEPAPSRERIRHELVGNLCRCTGYTKIVDAIEEYATSAANGEAAVAQPVPAAAQPAGGAQ